MSSPYELEPGAPQPHNPSQLSDLTREQSHAQHELLQEGLRQLVGNVAELAEGDQPGAVKAHLNKLLEDPEGNAPQVERMAAFEFLAAEQRAEIDRDTIETGGKMLDTIEGNNMNAIGAMKPTGDELEVTAAQFQKLHTQNVGENIAAGFDGTQLHNAHMRIAAEGADWPEKIDAHSDAIDVWAKAQRNEAQAYSLKVGEAEEHKQALNEGSTVVTPGYNGEAKDLSPAIDENVKNVAAAKLEALVKAEAPDEVLFDNIVNQQESELTRQAEAMRYKLSSVIDNIATDAEGTANISNRILNDTVAMFLRFAKDGGFEYASMTNLVDAELIFKNQDKLLGEIVQDTDQVTSLGMDRVSDAQTGLLQLRQQVQEYLARHSSREN